MERLQWLLVDSVPSELRGQQLASNLTPDRSIVGDDEQDTALLRKMADDAKQYMLPSTGARPFLGLISAAARGIFTVFFLHGHMD